MINCFDSGHLAEEWQISRHLCLVDLHKLIYTTFMRAGTAVDIRRRFFQLAEVYDQLDAPRDADWCRRFVAQVDAAVANERGGGSSTQVAKKARKT